MNCIILTRRMDFSRRVGDWLTAKGLLLLTQSSTIFVMALSTLTSGDFSMSPTRMVPMKALRISWPITPTRFFTRSRLRMSSSVPTATREKFPPLPPPPPSRRHM
ncbi:unnamed protein product [Ixodes pacificus]